MKILLIGDAYPPMKSSASVQLRDLSRKLVSEGAHLTMVVSSPGLKKPWTLEEENNVQILRLNSPQTKDIGLVARTINEFLMPFYMIKNFKKSPISKNNISGIIWYSPSIFFGPLIGFLKTTYNCQAYLIIRDIFPEWALDMGLIKKRLPYYFFKIVAWYQYYLADVIAIQTEGNREYFKSWSANHGKRIDVLQNWLSNSSSSNACSIKVAETKLANKTIFVYAGNMGIAQNIELFINLANELRYRNDIGFIFVGRGSNLESLKKLSNLKKIENVLFFDEIKPDEVPALYEQCDFGIVSLDLRHKTHNIPGKFVSYMHSGLPVIASINPGNDLADLINQKALGKVIESGSIDELVKQTRCLIEEYAENTDAKFRCRKVANDLFSDRAAANQVLDFFKENVNGSI